jgi:hypothetical protein
MVDVSSPAPYYGVKTTQPEEVSRYLHLFTLVEHASHAVSLQEKVIVKERKWGKWVILPIDYSKQHCMLSRESRNRDFFWEKFFPTIGERWAIRWIFILLRANVQKSLWRNE